MLPSGSFTLLVLLALFPGWLFVRLAETRSPRPKRSQLAELLELAAVGFTTTAIAALAIAAISTSETFSLLFTLGVWIRTGNQYLGYHLAAALVSTILCIALSCALALALFAIVYYRRAAGFKPGSSPWIHMLASTPVGKQNWVGVHRRDGSLVEGVFPELHFGAGRRQERDFSSFSYTREKRRNPGNAIDRLRSDTR